MKKKLGKGLLMLMVVVGGFFYFFQHQNSELLATSDTYQEQDPTISFLSEISLPAQRIARENGLYPSVMMAQAILESQNGQSRLASQYHNLFGIKGDYNGGSVILQTWEDDGLGNSYTIDAAFRAYPSFEESLEDYAALLTQNGLYAGTWRYNTLSYQDATAALTGTYATDTSYGAKLNRIIEAYQLTLYD